MSDLQSSNNDSGVKSHAGGTMSAFGAHRYGYRDRDVYMGPENVVYELYLSPGSS
jgi:hypothetical protein